METLNDSIQKLFEELLDESAKTDFIAKFGEDTFNKFEKAKQRMKNNGLSTDYQQYLKMSETELIDFLLSLYNDEKDAQKKRIISGTEKEIRGKYIYLGEKGGYKVYQPLNAQASMDLGVNTGWCTAGRYGHYGHPEYAPSVQDAEQHWKEYTNLGVEFYYFLNPDTMYGEYALALYPHIIEVYDEAYNERLNKPFYIKTTNFELFDAEDTLDYSMVNRLPLDLIPDNTHIDMCYYDKNGLIIEDGVLMSVILTVKNCVIPNTVKEIKKGAFISHKNLESVVIPEGVTELKEITFYGCKKLKSVTLPKSLKHIGDGVFEKCYSLTDINLPTNLQYIGDFAFNHCDGLRSIIIPGNVNAILTSAFSSCDGLESIIVSEGTKIIRDFAFAHCHELKSITLPKSLELIARNCFYADSLQVINYNGTDLDWQKLTEKTLAFYEAVADKIKYTNGYMDCHTGELILEEE